jgi:hypothetical protein
VVLVFGTPIAFVKVMMERIAITDNAARPSKGAKQTSLAVPARLYVLLVHFLGLFVLTTSVHNSLEQIDRQWSYLLFLTVAASLLSTKISRSGTRAGSVTISLGDFFVFVAMVILGPAAAAILGGVEGLISSLRVKIKRTYKILFNICQLALSSYLVGSLVFYLQGKGFLQLQPNQTVSFNFLVVLLCCGLLYFIFNSLLVAAAMFFVSKLSMREIGRKGFVWALPTIGVNSCLVVVLLSLIGPIHFGLALSLLPLLVIAYFLTGVRHEQTAGLFTCSYLPETYSQKAKGYLLGVAMVTIPIYFYCLHESVTLSDWSWLYLGMLAAVASCFPLRLFSLSDKIWLTLSDVFVFVALFQFGVEIAVVIASIEAVAFNLRCRPHAAYRWVFNLSQIILVAFMVGQFFNLLQAGLTRPGGIGTGTVVLLLITPWACGFLYYALSSGMTGLAVALSSRQSFVQVWVKNLNWMHVSVVGAVGAALVYVLVNGLTGL